MKQDIYLRDINDNVFILDTKYKMLNGNKCDKYGIKQADMYQMCSYALRGGYKNFILIYPEICALNDEIRFVINSGFGDVMIGIDILQVSFVLDYECFKNGEKIESLSSMNDEKLMRNLESGLFCIQ